MASVIQPSFSAGELSPTLFGRVDLAKYKVGAALMRNFFVDYRGGASNRTGTKFIARCKKSNSEVRLVPFQFSTTQTYVLEFGDLYMRVVKDGALVLETAKTVSAMSLANPGTITSTSHGFANGNTVFFTGTSSLSGKFFLVTNVTANTFQLTTLDGVVVNTSSYAAYVSGGTVSRVYELVTPYAAADLALLKFTQSADTLTIVHTNYAPSDLTRTGHAAWTLTPLSFKVGIAPPNGISATPTTGGTTYYSYVITAVDLDTGEESQASNILTTSSVNISATAGSVTTRWDPVPNAGSYNIYRAVQNTSAAPPVGVSYGYCGTTVGVSFADANTTPDFGKTPPTHQNPFAKAAIKEVRRSAVGSGYTNATVAITDSTGTGAVVTPIVDSGQVRGYIIVNGGEGYTNPTITVTGDGTGATATAILGPATGQSPSVVTYFQQRKIYAASANNPQTMWGSKPGAYKNFDSGIPTVDSDSFTFTLASQQLNNIKSMLSMPGGLVVLTGGGAWQLSGSGAQNSPLTATSAFAQPQAYNGCADLPPIPVNYEILYVQGKGSSVRDLSYNVFSNIYTGTDMTILSNHFFYGRLIKEWAYAEEPFKIIWCVRDDGKLLSFTFLKEQEVYGWAMHDTKGLFKSVATIQEGNENIAYFVVRRKINGAWVNYIERLASRDFSKGVEEGWFVDSGLDYPLNFPNATLTPAAATGTAVGFVASSSVFTSANVGDCIRVGGGIAVVTAYNSGTSVTCKITQDITSVIEQDSAVTPLEALPGAWSISTPVSTVSGLDHLEGQKVAILGDGNVFPQQTVTNGSVTLSHKASRIIVGLPYVSKLQTLPLDVGDPTIQGKRKKISALTLKVANTRGLKAGSTFTTLTEFKERRGTVGMGKPVPLITGQERITMDASWNVEGQICIQQDNPLPASILAVIPEVVAGDSK